MYPSLDRVGMAACVGSDGECYVFGGIQTKWVPDPTVAGPLSDAEIMAKATAVKSQEGRRSSALFRLEELGRWVRVFVFVYLYRARTSAAPRLLTCGRRPPPLPPDVRTVVTDGNPTLVKM